MKDSTTLESAKYFFDLRITPLLSPLAKRHFDVASHWKQYDGVWHVFNCTGSDMWHVMKGPLGMICRGGYYSPAAREEYGNDKDFHLVLRGKAAN